MFTRDELSAFLYKHFITTKMPVLENDCKKFISIGVDLSKDLVISNTFKNKYNHEYFIKKYFEDTTETSGIFLVASSDGFLDKMIGAIRDTAQFEIDESGTAKLFTVADVQDDVFKLYTDGFDPGIETDWMDLNNYYRAAKRQLCVVTGMGGVGKSTWLENYLVQVALKKDWKFCFYSPENYPVAYHVEKLMSMYMGKPFFKGMVERAQPADLSLAMAWVNSHFMFISADDNSTLDVCLNVFRQAIEKHGVDGVIIDPWNTVEQKKEKDQSETEYICQALTKCLGFTRRKNVAMWIVAHPSKPRRDRDGNFPPVSLYDISGSAHWANRPDAGLSVHRQIDGTTEVTVNKMRFRMYGGNGTVSFAFDKPSNKFTEITKKEELPKESTILGRM